MRVMFRFVAGFVLGYAVALVLCRGVGKDTRQKNEGADPRAWIRDVGKDTEMVTVNSKIYRDRGVVEFVDFLRNAVVMDPNGKVSAKSIWDAWAGGVTDTAVDHSERDRWHTLQ